MDSVKYTLPESKIPKSWYNIQADLRDAAPPEFSSPRPIDEALVCRKSGESKTILFNLRGHG